MPRYGTEQWSAQARDRLRRLCGLSREALLDFADRHVLRVEVPLELMNDLKQLAWEPEESSGSNDQEDPERRALEL